MSTGIFSTVGQSYFQAASNNWYYWWRWVHWLFKLPLLPVVIVYSVILWLIGLVFSAGIVFDWLGQLTDSIRQYILNAMREHSYRIDEGLGDFLFRPIWLVLLAPFLLISLLCPKLSSETGNGFGSGADDFFDGDGAFKTTSGLFFQAIKRLFSYAVHTHWLLKLPALGVAIFYTVYLVQFGVVFALLIPLDWLSRCVEALRQRIARTAHQLQYRIYQDFFKFLFISPLLIALAPVFMFLLIIPKITSHLSV